MTEKDLMDFVALTFNYVDKDALTRLLAEYDSPNRDMSPDYP
jgi:hypothetical protein